MSEENIIGGAHGGATVRTGRFYPAAADRLGRLLSKIDGGEATLYLALRDPAGYFESLYSQRLLSGRILPFEEFLRGLDVTLIRWSELVARLSALKGVSAITVWRFEDYPAVAENVLSKMLGPEAAAELHPPRQLIHPGLSQRAWKTVMREGLGLDRAEACQLANEARRRFPKTGASRGIQPFPAEVLEKSAATYERDLALISAMAGVQVIAPETGGFAAQG